MTVYLNDNTICLDVPFYSHRDEMICSQAAITPGHLCKMVDTGDGIRRVRKHDAAGNQCEKLFAIENSKWGKEIDDTYAVGEKTFLVIAKPGDIILCWLDGAVPTTGAGIFLTSNGDGQLRVFTDVSDEPGSVVGVAYERIANTGSDQRIAVRIV